MMHELGLTDSLLSTVAGGSPPVQALTLAYAKLHIRSLGATDDALISVYIDAAAAYFSSQTSRPTLTETRQAGLDAFPFLGASGAAARIELPHPPLQDVLDVQYIDADGVLRSFTDGASPPAPLWRTVAYAGDFARRGYVEPIFGQVWPIARAETDAVRLTYTCGYGDTPDAIPPLARGVLCYLVGHFDTFRTPVQQGPVAELPLGVQQMLDGFRYSALPSQVLRSGQVWR